MKKAIVTGSTGLIGVSVVKYLLSAGVEVLCLGRQNLQVEEVTKIFGLEVNYLSLPMQEILSLEQRISAIKWSPATDCIFFNFAWSGDRKLTDGTFEQQISNAIYAANSVKLAKKLGCIKFVNAGSLEETFAERSIHNKSEKYKSTQLNYAIAKLASRDLCTITAYLQKIDYVHTRLSAPIALDLSKGSYIASTLRKIAEGKSYEPPVNKQLFDIIFLDDVARAYYLIGQKGRNKADYFIGTSKPATLAQYFSQFEQIVNNNMCLRDLSNMARNSELFSISKLQVDTNFIPKFTFQDLYQYIQNH